MSNQAIERPKSRIRRDEQPNLERLEIQELAPTVPRVEQLRFPVLVDAERTAKLFDVKGDTAAARKTLLFDPGVDAAFRFVETTTYPIVRFCWTIERNAAGRFLTFRERATSNGTVKRDQFDALLKKSAAIRESKANRDAFDAQRSAKRARASGRK